MNISDRSSSIAAELDRTTRLQGEAADPAASVWVSANAGTGKTHVLTMRVLRLLLADTPPERILCLTYTKAAAAEMAKRVFDSLAIWVMLPEKELTAALTAFIGRAPTAEETARARTLFTRATETPGGLAVQTIHAFAERLLQRFPLEAGVTPGFVILDEDTSRKLLRDAIDHVIGAAARARDSVLGEALQTAIAYATDDRFDDVLADALRERDWLEAAQRLPASREGEADGFAAADALYRRHFGVRAGIARTAILEEIASVLSPRDLTRLRDVLMGGSKADAGNGAKIAQALTAATSAERADALALFFLKSDGAPREKFLTNALKAAHPDVDALITRAQGRFLTLRCEHQGATVVEATMALLRLADAVQQRYTEAKVRRAALDFDDLIARTKGLLSTREQAEWVLFKLDNGLDHILVDESQDTSPSQWRVVEAMASEFFSGENARADLVRTLFAVGDEKQSIYSFQGAAPEMFSRMGERFSALAASAGVPWRRIPLTLSFRTVAPVLDAVDSVFADPLRTAGITPAPHVAKRIGQAGVVEIWPVETADAAAATDAWSPLDEAAAEPPEVRLATRIAETIKGWMETGAVLESSGRPITPGDILILVRKRQPFATPMVQALKARGIPVAGADRMRLAEQIAVQDLLSLGDFLTLPEDDLALAEVLKSPIFGLDDGDLTTLAFERADPTQRRKRTLWKALLEAGEVDLRFAEAASTLKRWRKAADFRPPFEFFADLLDRDGVRARLLARIGPDAADPLDELLNLALTYDDGAPPSLAGFLAFMREGTRDIKRDMEHGRNEVRVMTVHGAKGLEAPIVFLPDTCSAGSASGQGGRPIRLDGMARPAGVPAPLVWPVKGTGDLDALRAARQTLRAGEREERDRLLYVAMTRARDRLYVGGFAGRRGPEAGCWYELISAGLAGALERIREADGREVLRRAAPQLAATEQPKEALARVAPADALPPWAHAPVPREAQLTVPLAPSRLAPYDTDDEGEPLPSPPRADPIGEPAATSPVSAPAAGGGANPDAPAPSRFLRGTLTHALLQHLPALPAAARAAAARAFLASRGQGLSGSTLASIAAETLALIDDPVFAAVFGPDSQAEVPLVAVIPRPDGAGSGPPLRITGQLDRLAILDDAVLIVDFKTNRMPPATLMDVAPAYLYQLAAYRLALREIAGKKPVRAALIWTHGPHLMEIPEEILESATKDLWRLDPLMT